MKVTRVNHKDYEGYKKLFGKYNVDTKAVEDYFMCGYSMVQTNELYERSESGRWKYKPLKSNTEEINATHYLNLCTWIKAFLGFSRVELKDTCIGRIPYKFTSISPDRKKKSVVTIEFKEVIEKNDIYKTWTEIFEDRENDYEGNEGI